MLMFNKLSGKIKKVLKDKTGMTLVELMTSFLLLSIVMAMSLSILMFTTNMYNRAARLNITKLSSDELFSYIEDRLTYAGHIEIIPQAEGIGNAQYENVITVIDGKLYSGKKDDMISNPANCDILENNAYAESELQLTTLKTASTVLDLKLEMIKDSEVQYTNNTSMQILAMLVAPDIAKKAYIESGSTDLVNPIISYTTGASFAFRDMGGPYTVDQQYDPDNQNPPQDVIEEPDEYDVPFSATPNGVYVRKNGKLYYWPAVGGDANVLPNESGHWWINVDDDTVDTDTVYVLHNVIYDSNGYYMAFPANATTKLGVGEVLQTPHALLESLGGDEVAFAQNRWARVYWNSEKAEDDNREYGWSFVPEGEGYVRACDFVYMDVILYKMNGTIPDGAVHESASGDSSDSSSDSSDSSGGDSSDSSDSSET